MRVVLIGATGNIGTALLRRLRQAHEVSDVVGIVRRLPDSRAAPYDGVDWRSIDIGASDARERLAEAMRGADAVVHLGWLLQPNHDEAELYQTNVTGTRNVFAAAAAARVPHLVYSSSIAAYSQGPKSRRVDESWPTGGIHTSHYSRHKAIVERVLDRFEIGNPTMTVTRIRPGLVLQSAAGRELASLFLGPFVPVALLRARPPVLPLPGRLISQTVHADDVAEAFRLVLERRAGGAFNIAAEPVIDPALLARTLGIRRSIRMPRGLLRAVMLVSWRLRIQRSDPGWLDIALYTPLMSTERARRDLDWKPTTSSTDAVLEVLDGIVARTGLRASPPLWPGSRR